VDIPNLALDFDLIAIGVAALFGFVIAVQGWRAWHAQHRRRRYRRRV
jgi:hypothetical protein